MSADDPTRKLSRDTKPAARASGGLAPGMEIAGHRIEGEVGRGGMGVVYRAHHLALDRERALKLITPELAADPRFRSRFERESRAAASIEHPNVVSVHHAGDDDGRLYISMRLIDGPDLGSLVEASGPFEPPRAARLVTQIAAALDAAHARGLVHRDVKPSNVLIETADGEERAFVSDFGISRVDDPGAPGTTTGEFFGSPDYAAPEQIEGGTVDRRADVYALGGLAHFLLTGEPPFPNRSEPAKLVAHCKAPRPRPSVVSGLPKTLDGLIAQAMAVDPAARFQSSGEFATAFARAVATPGRWRPAIPSARILGAGIGLAAVAALAAVLVFAPEDDPPDDGGRTARERPAARVIAQTSVGAGPYAVTVGVLKTWVAARDEGAVYGIDPATGAVDPGPVALGEGGRPIAVAVGFGSIWALDGENETLVRLEPNEPVAVSARIPIGGSPSDVVVSGDRLWVARAASAQVVSVDPINNSVDATVATPAVPRAIGVGEGSVWVACIGAGSVQRVDPESATASGPPISVGSRPSDVAVGEAGVWVLDSGDARLRRIDPRTSRVVGNPTPVGARPRGIATGFGSVWVANAEDGTVARIVEETGEPRGRPVEVGAEPAGIATGFGSVWTVTFADDQVSQLSP